MKTPIDYDITLKASHGAVSLGDTEEGAMAVRVNEAIRVTHGEKRAVRPGNGHIVNSAGDREIKHDFEKLRDEKAGDISIPAGGELVLRYRILFHRGDEKTARIAEHFNAYASER